MTKPKPLKECITISDFAYRQQYRYRMKSQEFLNTFKISLDVFWDKLTGLDVIAFDEWIKPRENENTNQAITRLYGSKGMEIIDFLVNTD